MLSVAGLAQKCGKGFSSSTISWKQFVIDPSVSKMCSIKHDELPRHQFTILKKDEVVGIFILETQCLIGVLQSSFFLSLWTYNDHHQWLNKYVLHCLATLMYS